MEPEPTALVRFTTSKGPLDIGLWTNECPLRCRRFIQLCLEGFYRQTAFDRNLDGHAIVGCRADDQLNWSVPSNEQQSPANFTHAGMVAFADEKQNGHELLITVDRVDAFNNKYIAFGRVSHDTMSSLLQIYESITRKQGDSVVFIREVQVLRHPFTDLELRPNVSFEHHHQHHQRDQQQHHKKPTVASKPLLSLPSLRPTEDEEEEEEFAVEVKAAKLKSKSSRKPEPVLERSLDQPTVTATVSNKHTESVRGVKRALEEDDARRQAEERPGLMLKHKYHRGKRLPGSGDSIVMEKLQPILTGAQSVVDPAWDVDPTSQHFQK